MAMIHQEGIKLLLIRNAKDIKICIIQLHEICYLLNFQCIQSLIAIEK